MDGDLLLEPGSAVLEIKVQQELPLWLVKILSDNRIYKTSFSKVGTAYKMIKENAIYQEERRLAHELVIQHA